MLFLETPEGVRTITKFFYDEREDVTYYWIDDSDEPYTDDRGLDRSMEEADVIRYFKDTYEVFKGAIFYPDTHFIKVWFEDGSQMIFPSVESAELKIKEKEQYQNAYN